MTKKTIDRFSVTLDRILKSCGMQARLQEYRLQSRWDRTVGPAIARHAQPAAIRGGKLQVIVDSPAWMQQLSLMKPEIIRKLNEAMRSGGVKDITLRLGEVAPSGAEQQEEAAPLPQLTDRDRTRIEEYLHPIGDADTREMVRRVIEKDMRSRKRTGKEK